MDEIATLAAQVADLEVRMAVLERARPGRKKKPIVVSREGVCGVEPTSDAETCPYASIYRRREGCLGTACVALNKSYYHKRRHSG